MTDIEFANHFLANEGSGGFTPAFIKKAILAACKHKREEIMDLLRNDWARSLPLLTPEELADWIEHKLAGGNS